MSHNPQAPEPFQFPKPAVPITENVHALLEKCRRRAREHGVTQFTGNADGLFGNELAAAMIADGKAVTPETNPDAYVDDLVKQYGDGIAGAILSAECLRLIFDTMRPHMERKVTMSICVKFGLFVPFGEPGPVEFMVPAVSRSTIQMRQVRRVVSQYGIRAIIHPELHEGILMLDHTLHYLEALAPDVAGELRIKFPLT